MADEVATVPAPEGGIPVPELVVTPIVIRTVAGGPPDAVITEDEVIMLVPFVVNDGLPASVFPGSGSPPVKVVEELVPEGAEFTGSDPVVFTVSTGGELTGSVPGAQVISSLAEVLVVRMFSVIGKSWV